MKFSYQDLMDAVGILQRLGYEVGSIGNSTLNRQIPYIFIGKTKSPCCFVMGGIHAREWLTSPLTLALIKYYFGDMGIYIVPMANPDGVELQQSNGVELGNVPKEYLISANAGNINFELWKANCRAVDLNVNFDADWGEGEFNITYPASANYIGEYPESEVETRNLVRFTKQINPIITISYHTKGEVIYYGYKNYPDYYSEALKFSNLTGYPLNKSNYSVGGYKDWFVKNYSRLGMTFEVGRNELDYPLPYEELEDMILKNKEVYNLLNTVGKDLWKKSL